MKTKIYLRPLPKLFMLASSFCMFSKTHAQNIFPSTGRAGIYTTSPAASLQVKGGARVGTLTNYVNIDSATGNLSFTGTATYRVANNQYAFQNATNPGIGLYFNATNARYEFRNSASSPTFYVGATTGNGVFIGNLKVGAYTLPATDGTNGQILKTNGSGALTWSADNNNIYSPGTGISIVANAITNTAPDQTVTLSSGMGISVNGTYPNFVITNTGTLLGWSLTGNAGTNPATHFIGTTDAQPLVFRVNNVKAGYLDYDPAKANTSFGHQGLFSNTTGYSNTAVGFSSLKANETGYYNTAYGYGTLAANINGYENTAVGLAALNNNTGNQNTAIGSRSLAFNTTGVSNTGSGGYSLYSNTIGGYNTATGAYSLYFNATGNGNTASGYWALRSNIDGSWNTANGIDALYSNTSGYSNVAVGVSALYSSTTGSNLVAIGDSALYHQNGGGGLNIAIGSKALYSNTTGSYNTATGYQALYSNTDGSYNTSNGFRALYSNTTGQYNTALGFDALQSNNIGTSNTAVGEGSLAGNTSGSGNTAVGTFVLQFNNTGNNNTAYGESSLYLNTKGDKNTASGVNSLGGNTTGNNNTANGYNSLSYNSTGSDNTAMGYQALLQNTVQYNTAIGSSSLYANTTGYNNTASGYQALYNNITGFNNTSLGVQALQSNISGNNNTAIGTAADVSANNLSDATAIGFNAKTNANDKIVIGTVSNSFLTGGYGAWQSFSDGRFKDNIKDNVPGLAFINKLHPVTYHLNAEKIDEFLGIKQRMDTIKNTTDKARYTEKLKTVYTKQQTGFIAQEVEIAAKKVSYDFDGVHHPENDKDNYTIGYASFVVPLVKAVQELSKMNDAKDAKIDTLQNQLNELRTLVLSIQQKQDACSPCSAVTNQSNTQSAVVLTDRSSLQQNIPNPFNNTTSIGYILPQKFTTAQIVIADKSGKTIKVVNISGSGKGSLNVDASTLASGAYQYSLMVDGKLIATKQMVLAK